MNKKDKKYTHIVLKDGHEKDYLCPVETIEISGEKDLDINECFEKDVPGRYAARINIRES